MATDGDVQTSTLKAADDPRLLQSTPAGTAAALRNGAVNHFTSKETQLVKLPTSQRPAVIMSAETSPPSPAVMATLAAANGAVTTTHLAPGDSQPAATQAEPPLRPQLLQRMQSLKEALDSQSLREPLRSTALRAFSTLCLACSPAAQASDSQVRFEDHQAAFILSHSHVCDLLCTGHNRKSALFTSVGGTGPVIDLRSTLTLILLLRQAVPPPALLAAAVRTISLAFQEVTALLRCQAFTSR